MVLQSLVFYEGWVALNMASLGKFASPKMPGPIVYDTIDRFYIDIANANYSVPSDGKESMVENTLLLWAVQFPLLLEYERNSTKPTSQPLPTHLAFWPTKGTSNETGENITQPKKQVWSGSPPVQETIRNKTRPQRIVNRPLANPKCIDDDGEFVKDMPLPKWCASARADPPVAEASQTMTWSL